MKESTDRACRPDREPAVGIWIELGIFILVIVFALWQIHDVKKARAKTLADKARQVDRDTHSP
jgi:hypothetical protein